jgi:hypothetical protein
LRVLASTINDTSGVLEVPGIMMLSILSLNWF